jgi:hypothetical protein
LEEASHGYDKLSDEVQQPDRIKSIMTATHFDL